MLLNFSLWCSIYQHLYQWPDHRNLLDIFLFMSESFTVPFSKKMITRRFLKTLDELSHEKTNNLHIMKKKKKKKKIRRYHLCFRYRDITFPLLTNYEIS